MKEWYRDMYIGRERLLQLEVMRRFSNLPTAVAIVISSCGSFKTAVAFTSSCSQQRSLKMPLSTSKIHHRRHQRVKVTSTSPLSSSTSTTTTSKIIQNRNRISSSSSALHVSPSGIDELPLILQSSIFFGIYALLGISTSISIQTIDTLSKSVIGLEKWRYQYIETVLPLLLGVVFFAAGIGHFISEQAFCDIYPPRGTWGIWYLPGSANFHVAWTGIVELLGGSGLLFGGLRSSLMGILNSNEEEDDEDGLSLIKLIQPISAATLFILTISVTPASMYCLLCEFGLFNMKSL